MPRWFINKLGQTVTRVGVVVALTPEQYEVVKLIATNRGSTVRDLLNARLYDEVYRMLETHQDEQDEPSSKTE